LSSRTVVGNVAFPLEIAGVKKKERRKKAKELIVIKIINRRTQISK